MSPVLSPASLAEAFISRVSQQGLHQRLSTAAPQLNTIRQGNEDSLCIFIPGSGGLLTGAAPLLASLDTDATVLALEHAHVELSEVLINAYTEVVASALEPHIKEVVFVGVSMGGLLAPRLADEILKAPAVEQVKIVLLDSPPPAAQQAQVPECAKIEAVYIGAEDGQHSSVQSVEQIWTKVLPKMTFHKLRCSHFDIWGESHAKETATIISEFLR